MLNSAIIFIAVSLGLTAFSFILDGKKTVLGLQKGFRMFKNIVVPFLNILILVSLLLYVVPVELIVNYLGPNSGSIGLLLAAIIGSITLIPGFISYPLSAMLISQGATYTVVATFMTTMMMVGVVTFPLEAKYFGRKVAFIRNSLNFIVAIIIGLAVGWLM